MSTSASATSSSSGSRSGEESTTAWKLGFKNPALNSKSATTSTTASSSGTNSADLAPTVRDSDSGMKEPSGSSLMGVMTGEKKALRAGVAATSASGTGVTEAGTGAATYRDRTPKSVETGTKRNSMEGKESKARGGEGMGWDGMMVI